ncbi:UNVERIFIED_CONTAM: hypothetical protein Sangu_0711300 [Sesamum angustifolium]|uniref:Uncharacterized protein n=1 Tax=Sesamum angustifolium TaxID=2727405 RepID=A0AAW2PSB9_9LAMI
MYTAKTGLMIEMRDPEVAVTDMEVLQVWGPLDMKEEAIGTGPVPMTALGGEGDPLPWNATERSCVVSAI